MGKKGIRLIIVFIMVILALCGGAFIYYKENLKPTGTSDEKVIVKVETGTSYQGLFNQLEDADLIHSSFIAKIYLKLSGANGLQANTYELNKGMSLPEIMEVVATGDFNYLTKVQMTVPEGLTIPEVADIVAEIASVSRQDVLNQWADTAYLQELINDYWFLDGETILQEGIMYPLEGYLYPETYTVASVDPSVDELTRMMLDFTSDALEKYKDGMDALGFTPHEFLTFASIVERESLFDEDRPMIAEVFLNRLADGMALESDITVLYALKRTGLDLTIAEIQSTDSYYNTYLYAGLPIGPISNVSDVTMNSCVNHDDNDYYYFYARPDGKVLYGRTLEEHNENVANNPWD